jgi:hypothetical protein
MSNESHHIDKKSLRVINGNSARWNDVATDCVCFANASGGCLHIGIWDDFSLSPVELIDAIWQDVADFHESYELADGLYRSKLPAYDPRVVRELLVNALVHRPYT